MVLESVILTQRGGMLTENARPFRTASRANLWSQWLILTQFAGDMLLV